MCKMVVVEGLEEETRVDVADGAAKPTVLHGYTGYPALATAQNSHAVTSVRQTSVTELCERASGERGKVAPSVGKGRKESQRRSRANLPWRAMPSFAVTSLLVKVAKG